MRADHTLDLSVAMAMPPIRPHPARWLLERPEQTNRARLRDHRDLRNERNDTILYGKGRNETKLYDTKKGKVANSWVSTHALPREGVFHYILVCECTCGSACGALAGRMRRMCVGRTLMGRPSGSTRPHWVAPGGSMPPPQLCSCRLSERPEKVYPRYLHPSAPSRSAPAPQENTAPA